MKMWIVRRKNNKLYVFFEKPEVLANDARWFVVKNIPNHGVFIDYGIKIDENLFPEVTFENSPMEVELVIKNVCSKS